ncbi:MAG: AraC family transcriptional regulator, partial [Oscillospiraceae bacterium]|nr:AraC family transcriptional regulator [Oscillospiraceae bacterium]
CLKSLCGLRFPKRCLLFRDRLSWLRRQGCCLSNPGYGGLQVQTVAQHCGMSDVNYFSKLFKKQYGVTPRQYRAENRHYIP